MAASGSTHLAPKTCFVDGLCLGHDLQHWIHTVWPSLALPDQTIATLAVSNLSPGFEVSFGFFGQVILRDDRCSCPPGAERVFHGCNPYALDRIMRDGLLESKGKGGWIAIYTSTWKHVAFSYPQELERGIRVSPTGPEIRVVLECVDNIAERLHRYHGRRNKSGKVVNEQILYKANCLRIDVVHVICTRRAITPITRGDQLDPPFLDERKFRSKLRRVAEKVIHAHGIADIDENRALEFSAPSRRAPRAKKLGFTSKALKHKLRRLRRKSGCD